MTTTPERTEKISIFKKGGVLDAVFSDHFDIKNATSFYERQSSEQSSFVEDTLENMKDISFQVSKVQRFLKTVKTQKFPRILKFTKLGILTCKTDGITVLKAFSYDDVTKILLIDLNNFVIYFNLTKDNEYHYQSQSSVQIVQELTIRVKSNHKSENWRRKAFELAELYQKQCTSLISHSQNLIKKSELLRGKQLSEEVLLKHQKSFIKKKQELKLLFTEKEEMEIFRDAQEICFQGEKETEVFTINDFINNFSELKQDETAVKATRRFISGMTNYIKKKRDSEFEKLFKHYEKNYEMPEIFTIEYLIERILQKSIIIPLKESLEKCILTKKITGQDSIFKKNQKIIYKQTQLGLGIPSEFKSTNGWITAISKLEKIKDVDTPSEKLNVLIQTSNEIYKAHSFYQSDKEKKSLLSGDDFLPIFIYIASKVKLQKPFLMVEMILQLGDPKSMSSEHGYYLMVFLSALNVLIEIEEK
eukprot:gene1066-10585_t